MSKATVSNEAIVAAIMQAGTIETAAQNLGISPRTIYDRRRELEFQTLYSDAKNELIRQATFSINRRLSEAVEAVAEIMNDTTNNAAVRLQAAQVLIGNAAKFADRLNQDEMRSRTIADPFDFLGVNLK